MKLQNLVEIGVPPDLSSVSDLEQPVSMNDIADLIKKLAVQQKKKGEAEGSRGGMGGGPGDVNQNVRSIMYKLNQHFGIR